MERSRILGQRPDRVGKPKEPMFGSVSVRLSLPHTVSRALQGSSRCAVDDPDLTSLYWTLNCRETVLYFLERWRTRANTRDM